MEQYNQLPEKKEEFKIEAKHLVYTYLVVGIVHFLGHFFPSLYYKSDLQAIARTTIYLGGFSLFIYLLVLANMKKSKCSPYTILLGVGLTIFFTILDVCLYFQLEWGIDIKLDGIQMNF